MTLLEAKQIVFQWPDINNRVQHKLESSERSPGLHLSTILRLAAIDLGLLKTGQVDEEDIAPDEMPLKMVLGLAWEHYLAGFYPDMHWQPGEVERDGVAGSPDGITFVAFSDKRVDELAIDEVKLTWKSNRDLNILDRWMWMRQVMGYCAMHYARPVIGRFHVGFVNGDYRHPYTPVYVRYTVRFEPDEIERNWDLVLNYKEQCNV